MLIDSGTRRNLITAETWRVMKDKRVKVEQMLKSSDVAFKAYGQSEPIPVIGRFQATLKLNQKTSLQWFYVVEKGEICLLGEEASVLHGVLRVGGNEIEEGKKDAFPKIRGN
jgi:hypothetical protein